MMLSSEDRNEPGDDRIDLPRLHYHHYHRDDEGRTIPPHERELHRLLPWRQDGYHGHTGIDGDAAHRDYADRHEERRGLVKSSVADLLSLIAYTKRSSELTNVLSILHATPHLGWVVGSRESVFGPAKRTLSSVEDLFKH